jgi:hypothetical protein
LRFVVADCATVLPLGNVMLNVTLAPDTGEPPFSTLAVIDTVLLRV